MSKQVTAGQLVQGQKIIFDDMIETVRRVRLIAHDTVLLAAGDVEVRVPLNRKYTLVGA